MAADRSKMEFRVSAANVLPDCRPKVERKLIRLGNLNWTPIYCANCGTDGGMVPSEYCDFAFYLCIPCSEKWGPLTNTYMEPDHVFWERVIGEQIETYGRVLTLSEQEEVLRDDNSTLAKLAKDKPDFSKIKMT